MLDETTGFSASLVVLPSATGTASSSSAPPAVHPQPEHCHSVASAVERIAWIEGVPDAPIRVLFGRESRVKPIRGLEVFASYLFCPGETPWVKIYAIGDGVARCSIPWCIDGRFGPQINDLGALGDAKISLKVYPCELLPGTELGNGMLYTKDVAVIDRQNPLVVFTWQYGSREQLRQLGVLPEYGLSQLDAHALYSPLSTSLEFLRMANKLAIGLMMPAQRAQLADALAQSNEVLALLPWHAQRELRRYRTESGMADSGPEESEETEPGAQAEPGPDRRKEDAQEGASGDASVEMRSEPEGARTRRMSHVNGAVGRRSHSEHALDSE